MDKLLCTGTEPNKWAMHSIADAVHDGGTYILKPDGINFAQLFVNPLEAGIYDEDVVKDKLIKSLPPERQRQETFLVRTDTDLSPVKGVFQLAKTSCNSVDKTLVYQDAGPTVYDLICNGLNALNPGSVCDPASRSLDNAVFTRSPDTFRIRGCVFGFNEDIVPAIILKNFTGKTIVCGVQYREKWYDMAAGKEVDGENEVKTVKHINKPAGFLSGNGVNGVLKQGTPNVHLFYIGKLLGDALQVITMLPTISGTLNPYYQIKAEGETQLINTHDRLQYARAVYLGVGALLTFKKGNTKQAAYTPGAGKTLTGVALINYYKTRIEEARATIKNRFDEALRSMADSLLGPGDSFRNNYSKVDGYVRMVSSEEKTKAKEFMQTCILRTTSIRLLILEQFKEVDNLDGKSPEDLQAYYRFIHSRIASQSPGGPIISGRGYNTKGNITNRFKIAITETNDYIIDFRYAFEQMENGARPGDPYGGTNKWLKEPARKRLLSNPEVPPPKRQALGGKRKLRKGTFRKKGGELRKLDPATQGVKAVNAFTSKVYAYEARLIGFNQKGEVVIARNGLNTVRLWEEATAESTEYIKPIISVSDNERNSIKEKFNYVPPEGVTVTWENMLVADLKENKDSLLVDFMHFITPEILTDLVVENEKEPAESKPTKIGGNSEDEGTSQDGQPPAPAPPASPAPASPNGSSGTAQMGNTPASAPASAPPPGGINGTPPATDSRQTRGSEGTPVSGSQSLAASSGDEGANPAALPANQNQEKIVNAFLKAKVLIEDAVESNDNVKATKVQDATVLGLLKEQLDLYLYSLTGRPPMPLGNLPAAPPAAAAAPGVNQRLDFSPNRPTGGKRRTRRMKRLFR